MNVRDWPMDQIMQLPDNCFGRRWPIGVGVFGIAVSENFVISPEGLPDRCVIWEYGYWLPRSVAGGININLALGDSVPTSEAEFDRLMPLFPDFGALVVGKQTLQIFGTTQGNRVGMRMPVAAQGRRLVMRVDWLVAVSGSIIVYIIVSSMPTEVPDCLLSGYLRSQS